VMAGQNVYFGGKLVAKGVSPNVTNLQPVAADRLGSIGKFYPYGQEINQTADLTEKFTGYFRDAGTGLDYADQRYYEFSLGRFTSPDPYGGSANLGDPGSWNRYAYVGGDPINYTDRRGLYRDLNGDSSRTYDDWGYGLILVGYSFGGGAHSILLDLYNIAAMKAEALEAEYEGDVILGAKSLSITSLSYPYGVAHGVQLSEDYSQFFNYLQDCGCRPIDWGGAWDDIIGAVRNGGFLVRNLPLFVLAGLQAIFKKDAPIPKPKGGLPTGTKGIDEMGWDHGQIEAVKEGVGARAPDWVGVDPKGNVWTGSPSGEAVEHGPARQYWP